MEGRNIIDWFEIPVSNLKEATTFYENIFGIQFTLGVIKNINMAFFPRNKVSGALAEVTEDSPFKSGNSGTVVYFNGGDDLNIILNKIPSKNIITPKTLITNEIGYYAMFRDIDNNVIGLHSMK